MAQRRASLGKITRPNVSAVLPRKRLFALLDAQGAAAWVTGPPGCGKTTLAASWLDHVGLRSLWYQLDEGDADIATFFYYLSIAAAARDDGVSDPLPLLTAKAHRFRCSRPNTRPASRCSRAAISSDCSRSSSRRLPWCSTVTTKCRRRRSCRRYCASRSRRCRRVGASSS